jgi:glycosyltransferase involved in cell wall biosynthesis
LSDRPTILQIIPQLDAGGAELAVVEITEAVVRAGGRMLVLSEGGRLAGAVRDLGGETIDFPAATKNPARIIANGSALADLIARESVHLLHARSRAPAWSALIAARRTGRPLVTTYHGAYSGSSGVKNAYNSVMARGDRVIANSHFTARLIAERHQTPPERMRVIHRGVDPCAFDPDAVAPERLDHLRARWQIEPGDRVVLQAARLTGWKGQATVIEAARLLLSDPNVACGGAIFVLAGDAQGRDGYVDGLRAQIASARLGDRVRLVGHCSDIAAAFRLADVTVVASTEPEAFGRAATEAMAMGCPVIATNIGAPPETIRTTAADATDSATGWLVPPGDAEALAVRIGEALALGESARRAMGAAARQHVVTRFSLHAMKHATLEVYDELLGTRLAHAFLDRGSRLAPGVT